ncbi:hypothetical protein H6G76_28035 [Nostoc sp. FACHB-152]|uniref:hypothetical protein n=1 Tax=unclassified Nostoc TaxID=2593658 RepID=UPI001686B445|nr:MULTISPECIES: hypothetical protein [unclassified Nostoc]MBD2450909.1 hypothetical protein [Nostoc sp. FACHB-152]MBD2470054.1 hypothetical protein [Nostoc sp. FACHB-145]
MYLGVIAVLILLFLGPSLWIGYQTFMSFGWTWMLLLLPIAWLVGLFLGAIAAMFLTGILEWISNFNQPPAESGSMGGVAWLGIWVFLALITSPFFATISTWLTANVLLPAFRR